MQAKEIRSKFVKFFEKHGHIKRPSSSLIPQNDPTLLFANAGMNQFKDIFTGQSNSSFKRAVTIQKCVRAGGKHNDLENVGFTARHHTFFEMLGNFSFGDYFKKEAIEFGWNFLTQELNIPAEKLLVTIHYSDDEAFDIWKNHMGLPENKIFRKGDKDNFWEMGEFGPCGPCSEIFYDHGEKYTTPGFTPTEEEPFDDGGRFVEVWNLVFMQYEKTREGRRNLPKPSIDTGAGLERLAAATQGKYWNYDTDLFMPIIREIEKISKKKYSDPQYQGAMRVVADHIRSSVMLITDGVIPSNEGRGYVLRRIIRRAIRQLKNLESPALSFHKLIPTVFEILGDEYPQNKANQALAEKLLQLEEKKFLETLDHGLKFLHDAIKTDVNNNTLSGEAIFKLYDTYGFPVDLTELILQEKNLKADIDGFQKHMQKRKEDSRKSWKGGALENNEQFYTIKEKFGATEFVGYNKLTTAAKLLSIINLENGNSALIFDITPFYAESGGQAADIGTISTDKTTLTNIIDVQKPVDGLFVHFVKDASMLEVNNSYTLTVDKINRALTARNHSATHLLQAALIKHLGEHVKQAGSHVSATRLRFDFTHPEKVDLKTLKAVEDEVNQQISNDLKIEIKHMNKEEAIKCGAQALFGEKYGDVVRVVKMEDFSTELCGGTHLESTGEISLFLIQHESALSSGIRRIEALTSTTAIEYLKKRSSILEQLEKLTKVKEEKVVQRFEQIGQENKNLQKELKSLQEKLEANKSATLFSNPLKIGDIDFKLIEVEADTNLKNLADLFADRFKNGILVSYAKTGEKFKALVKITNKNSTFDAGKILREALSAANGRGGGRKDMAQGSGETSLLDNFLDKIKELIK